MIVISLEPRVWRMSEQRSAQIRTTTQRDVADFARVRASETCTKRPLPAGGMWLLLRGTGLRLRRLGAILLTLHVHIEERAMSWFVLRAMAIPWRPPAWRRHPFGQDRVDSTEVTGLNFFWSTPSHSRQK